ncbi:hypothetical protein H0A36_03855 [Endozoicomonas sp. SM1973]|uniref:Uncharacterized protein n=1 Tax=Spartinivicinus marinus TaxID=2994442 RepID=A0A853HTP1_9GAMM|nr:hypothetical protein [Spartinivicinus marinus]MCX4029555.1 hypothetical protein [Spartinivicinus marinus]NYZ65130.1 hypothetical protein [Spartinivicinus marinus]
MVSLLIAYQYTEKKTVDKNLRHHVKQQGNSVKNQIKKQMELLVLAANYLKDQIQQTKHNDQEIRQLIKNMVQSTSDTFRGGVVFKRYRFNKTVPLSRKELTILQNSSFLIAMIIHYQTSQIRINRVLFGSMNL